MFLAFFLAQQGAASWPTVTVDVTQKTAISPYIYGANSPDWDKNPAPYTAARLGGNRMTAYNWENNASNAGNDWHNQNDDYMGKSDEAGWLGRTFIQSSQAHDAAVFMTIPTAGHVSADKSPGGDVNQTPGYMQSRFEVSLPHKPGMLRYPPDLSDGRVYQDEAVSYYQSVSNHKTPLWYILDNEPDLWQSTHARIVPNNVGFAGIVKNNVTYAKAIKNVAPKALVFGLASYGWEGYVAFQGAPDQNGREFLDFYLSSMAQAQQAAGMRLVDVLDLHWYPEAKGDGKRITDDINTPAARHARVEAPRSLWDPTYKEDSWIADSINHPISLIPWVQEKIAKNYPGTKLAFNEYNYGGAKDPSGMVAQADVLGIFGRNDVFAACNWGIDSTHTAEQAAFRAFLDFDGKGSRFASQALPVTGEVPEENSIYASADPQVPGRIVLVVVNKTASSHHWSVVVPGTSATGFLADYANPTHHTAQQVSRAGDQVSGEIPAYGVETVEIKP